MRFEVLILLSIEYWIYSGGNLLSLLHILKLIPCETLKVYTLKKAARAALKKLNGLSQFILNLTLEYGLISRTIGDRWIL